MKINLLLFLFLSFTNLENIGLPMTDQENISPDVAIVGSGYVGLVAACCLAKLKKQVCCVDIDKVKIDKLKNKICPFYEPGLDDLLNQAVDEKLIEFTSDIDAAILKSKIIFIAVNTPTKDNGDADISAVKAVAKTIAKNLNAYKIICLKSTVPIGTHKIVETIINEERSNKNVTFDIVSIPEFLREGSAIYDFLNPNRIVIGTKSKEAFECVKSLFDRVNVKPENIIWTTNLAAEAIKYVANTFLALKVSFTNEVASFCDASGIDTISVMHAVGKDERIGPQFFNPGPGFGGSCFPKDVKALKKMIEDKGIDPKITTDILLVNEMQKLTVVKRICNLLNNDIRDKNIAILGLAFKANTDDIREAPALTIIKELVKLGANIKAYDPKANANMKLEIPSITYCDNLNTTVEKSDAILILTEWQEFKSLDLNLIKDIVRQKIILDTRNVLNPELATKYGFVYDAIGRQFLLKK
jgi:UDPglucose 6-dehydrogenase